MIKKLMSCIREYKKDTILSPVFVTLEVVMEIIIPLLMANIIDYGITDGNMNYILKIGIALVVLAMLSLMFGALSGRSAARASAGFAKNIRHDEFYSIQKFSFSNIDKFSTPSLVTRMTTDVTNLQNAYQMIIRILVRSPIMLVFSIIMAFQLNHELSMIFLILLPIISVGLFFIIRFAHPVFKRVFKKYDKMNNVVQEDLRGIRVVKSYVREPEEIKKFNSVSEEIYTDFSKAEKLLAFNAPLMQFAVYACMLLFAWLGAQQIVYGDLSTGQLMSLITYAMQILMSLMMISMILVMVTMARASAERVVEVLEEVPDLKNPENPLFAVADGSVKFESVDFSYINDPNNLCLKDVNLDIKAGQVIGIIGGTGSSKTTLVQMIPRLYDATKGTVLVGGKDVREYDLEALRDGVAMVLQNNILFSGTIKENLRWGKEDATDEEIVHACELAQANEFIRAFPDGYDTYIEQGGSNVSGGQKQRLCIARALLKNPKILILDDSTSAVDMKTDALIRKAFKEEIPDITKLIIAQRIASVEDADQIVVMDGGKVDAVGTHEELLNSNSIYQVVFYSQTKGSDDDDVA
jgi:ATP-binding cassette subfamily B multidrug efflux pump